MATYSKIPLSGSSFGALIGVGTLSTPIHTGPDSIPSVHEVWVYACNSSNVDVNLTIQLGSSFGVPTGTIFNGVIEAYSGNVLVIPGFIVKETVPGNPDDEPPPPLQFTATASIANSINLVGYVNQIQ